MCLRKILSYPKTAKYHVSSESREVVPSRLPTAEDQKYNIQLPIAPMGRIQCIDLPTYSMMRVKTLARSLHVDLLRLYGLNEREIRRMLCNNPFITDYCTISNSMFTEDEIVCAVRESKKNKQLRSINAQYMTHSPTHSLAHSSTHSSTYSLAQHTSSQSSPSLSLSSGALSGASSGTSSRPSSGASSGASSSSSSPSRSHRPLSPLSIRH